MIRADSVMQMLPDTGAVLITKPENMVYVSSFGGEGAILLKPDGGRYILTDFRYVEAAQLSSPGWEVLSTNYQKTQSDILSDLLTDENLLYYEDDYVTAREMNAWKKTFSHLELRPLNEIPEQLRLIKTEDEILWTEKAEAICDQAFTHMLSFLKPGLTEKEVALELYVTMMALGAEGLSFSTIVASGVNGSLPHAVPSDKKLEAGEFVTMDFGCKLHRYCADFTRTVSLGEPDEELKKIYEITLEANLRAEDALCAGKSGSEVDAVARDIIKNAGYGDCFGHGLGHGTGLLIHEGPRLSPSYSGILSENMLTSVEPGIYLPGKGGVRIEDLCVVTRDGCRNLTHSEKRLLIL